MYDVPYTNEENDFLTLYLLALQLILFQKIEFQSETARILEFVVRQWKHSA